MAWSQLHSICCDKIELTGDEVCFLRGKVAYDTGDILGLTILLEWAVLNNLKVLNGW
jgi:hypothetical protein